MNSDGENIPDMTPPHKRLHLSINTTSGELQAQIDVPEGFIPITDLVPVVRSLAEQAQALEVSATIQSGKKISCQKGCGACCQRIMVPISPPEALALAQLIEELPQDHRATIKRRLMETRNRLQAAELLSVLQEWAESPHQKSDLDIDSINHAYYALRLPCIFLENDACSIYEHRPAACREFLVATPAEWCQDTEKNPVQELHIPIRAGTVLSIVWADLTGEPVRLMPLPIAFEWAEKYQAVNKKTWKGFDLFHMTLDGLGKFLQQTFSLPSPKKQG